MWRRLLFTALMLCASAGSHAADDPALTISTIARALRPGEMMIVDLKATAPVQSAEVHAFGRTIAAFRDGNRWRALVGIDLAQAPASYTIDATATIDGAPHRAEAKIVVAPRSFPTRRLSVAPDFVNPPPALLERITREQEWQQSLFRTSASERLWRGAFVRPVPGRANSSFGTRSVFNNEPRNPHAGTDFLSPAGTPIHAPAGGRIVGARDLFFTGNTVIIDHGLGLFSTLAHMSKINVREGDVVAAGDVVGLVGATGRVTGAHLHWSLSASGARVDPLSALELLRGVVPRRQARPSAR